MSIVGYLFIALTLVKAGLRLQFRYDVTFNLYSFARPARGGKIFD
jgi:hypothetical protein